MKINIIIQNKYLYLFCSKNKIRRVIQKFIDLPEDFNERNFALSNELEFIFIGNFVLKIFTKGGSMKHLWQR